MRNWLAFVSAYTQCPCSRRRFATEVDLGVLLASLYVLRERCPLLQPDGDRIRWRYSCGTPVIQRINCKPVAGFSEVLCGPSCLFCSWFSLG